MSTQQLHSAGVSGPLLEDLSLLGKQNVETLRAPNGKLRYRIAGTAMAWCGSIAEAVKIASILLRSRCNTFQE